MGHDIRAFRGFNELSGAIGLAPVGYFLSYETIFTDNKILSLNDFIAIFIGALCIGKEGISIHQVSAGLRH